MNRYKAFLFVMLSLLFLKEEANAKTMHAILVGDTLHDTKLAAQTDLQCIRHELLEIAKQTGMTLKQKVFTGKNFQKQSVQQAILALTVDPSDVVIFYFSGHGYRYRESQSPFPILTFQFYYPGIDLQWIANKVCQKKPQFALLVADCCNHYLERGFVNKTKNVRINLHPPAPYRPAYQALFSNSKGAIIVCSSSTGQFSYHSRYGGLFTQCLFASLCKETHAKAPNWKRLLERASSYIKDIQKPVYQLYE